MPFIVGSNASAARRQQCGRLCTDLYFTSRTERLAPRLNGGKSGNSYLSNMLRSALSSAWEYSYTGTGTGTVCNNMQLQPYWNAIRQLGARETISVIVIGKSMLLYFYNVCTSVQYIVLIYILELYSFYPLKPKCITQSKTQRSAK